MEQPGLVGLAHDPSQCLQCSSSTGDRKDHVILVPTQQENKIRPRTGTNDSAISSDSSHTPTADHVITSHTPNRVDSGLDEEADRKQHNSVAGSLGGVAGNDVYDIASSGGSSTTIESHVSHKLQCTHDEQKQAVRKEVLSLVAKLSSEVASRANSQGLNL